MLYRWREERDRSGLILARPMEKSAIIAFPTAVAGDAAPASAGRPRRRAAAERRHIGMLAVLVACAALMAAAAPARADTAHDQSAKMVARAETLIREAGESNPADTNKIYRAIKILRNATKIDPRNDAAFVDLGFCYGVLRDPSTAVDMYTRAVNINPSAANFLELADIYMRVGNSSKALMAANAGLTKNPHDARLWNAKGMALNDLMQVGAARHAFARAVKLDPSFVIARQNLQAVEGRMPSAKAPARQ